MKMNRTAWCWKFTLQSIYLGMHDVIGMLELLDALICFSMSIRMAHGSQLRIIRRRSCVWFPSWFNTYLCVCMFTSWTILGCQASHLPRVERDNVPRMVARFTAAPRYCPVVEWESVYMMQKLVCCVVCILNVWVAAHTILNKHRLQCNIAWEFGTEMYTNRIRILTLKVSSFFFSGSPRLPPCYITHDCR